MAKYKSALKKITTPKGPKPMPNIGGSKSPSYNIAINYRKKKGNLS